MNKKGMVLVLCLFVVLVLAGLSSTFLFRQINMSYLSTRYSESTAALWVAEAGLQRARASIDSASLSGSLGDGSYSVVIERIGTSLYYTVISTGTVGGVSRTIEAVVSKRDVNADNFAFGLESTTNINFAGSALSVTGENTDTVPVGVDDPDPDPEYYKENSNMDFQQLFCFNKAEIKELAESIGKYYTEFPETVSGLTWVENSDSHFTGNITGSGILIIEGSFDTTGTITFSGIIYVIGELKLAGTPNVIGSILAESSTEVDTKVAGASSIRHDHDVIDGVLNSCLGSVSPTVVSWKEQVL